MMETHSSQSNGPYIKGTSVISAGSAEGDIPFWDPLGISGLRVSVSTIPFLSASLSPLASQSLSPLLSYTHSYPQEDSSCISHVCDHEGMFSPHLVVSPGAGGRLSMCLCVCRPSLTLSLPLKGDSRKYMKCRWSSPYAIRSLRMASGLHL
jgi:hypothetical protein